VLQKVSKRPREFGKIKQRSGSQTQKFSSRFGVLARTVKLLYSCSSRLIDPSGRRVRLSARTDHRRVSLPAKDVRTCPDSHRHMAPPATYTLCCVCGSEAELQCSACARADVRLYFCSPEHQKLVGVASSVEVLSSIRATTLTSSHSCRYGSLTSQSAARAKPTSENCPTCRPPNSKSPRSPRFSRRLHRQAGAISTFLRTASKEGCISRPDHLPRCVTGCDPPSLSPSCVFVAGLARPSAADPLCSTRLT
jgi:hypothetical protein